MSQRKSDKVREFVNNKKVVKRTLSTAGLIAALLLCYQNCGQGFKANSSMNVLVGAGNLSSVTPPGGTLSGGTPSGGTPTGGTPTGGTPTGGTPTGSTVTGGTPGGSTDPLSLVVEIVTKDGVVATTAGNNTYHFTHGQQFYYRWRSNGDVYITYQRVTYTGTDNSITCPNNSREITLPVVKAYGDKDYAGHVINNVNYPGYPYHMASNYISAIRWMDGACNRDLAGTVNIEAQRGSEVLKKTIKFTSAFTATAEFGVQNPFYCRAIEGGQYRCTVTAGYLGPQPSTGNLKTGTNPADVGFSFTAPSLAQYNPQLTNFVWEKILGMAYGEYITTNVTATITLNQEPAEGVYYVIPSMAGTPPSMQKSGWAIKTPIMTYD